MDEGTKNTSFDHRSAGKWASSIARQVKKEEVSRTIKLEDLAKLVSHVQPSFKNLDSPEDDPIIVVDDGNEDEEADKYEVHPITNAQTKDASVPKSSSPSNSLPTELKDLSSKFNELTKEVKGLKKQVHELEIKLPRYLKEIPTKLEDFTKTVTIYQKSPLNLRGEHIKKDKGKKALSSEEAKKESTDIDFDDDETHVTESMVESSRIKKVKKFDFVTKDGKHIHLTEEQINQQKKIEEKAKA
ncbi:hypothetical protein Tco_1003139 [Tanacetum coccineum]|uniref:Uncharacterized protein n=1 Tax=Tanacetum coccineum TaxID=301880 RepID=A0ABQ5F8H9_9ASTR